MNVTPPHSGTASAHGASHLRPAKSSLGDFLQADSPANSGEDFKAIAAAMFGAEESGTSAAEPSVKESAAGKDGGAGLTAGRVETRKGKESSDADTTAANPELTVPLTVTSTVPLQTPQPSLDLATKSALESDTLKPQNIKAVFEGSPLEGSAMLTGQGLGDGNEKMTKLASSEESALLSKSGGITPQLSISQPDTQALAAIKGDQTDPGNLRLAERPATADDAMQALESAARVGAAALAATTKKTSADGSGESRSNEPKQISTPASTNEPTVSTDVPPVVNAGLEQRPAADSMSSASTLESIATASAKKILDSSITAKAGQPSATDSRNASVRAIPGGNSKIKDREIRDRGIKDAKVAMLGGKLTPIEAGDQADGPTKPAVTNKDVEGAGVATHPAHSDANAKAVPLKQSVGAASPQPGATELDGPDEALPTSASSQATTAKFLQSVSQSEFRVGMQTEELGNVDIRTSVARHMFSAQISVEHGDVAKSMTADLPALYHRLADQQVPVASIVIQGQNLATSSGLAQDTRSQTWRPQSYHAGNSDGEPRLPVMTEALDSGGRLDIRI